MNNQKVRRLGCSIEEHDDYIFCYIGQTKGMFGVGFLIRKTLKDKIINFTGISERIALLQLKFGKLDMSIIQVYAPTEKASESDLQKFYTDLKKAHSLADDRVLVLGDFNAKIGKPTDKESLIMGKYGIGKNPTENGHGGHLILTPKMK
ncbi:unnamed protein product [Colias eurytheme]|nr:unnamed protein product [Colias eurytheme]CAG4936621.1 unnamed protein product [Colias eurytheme]